MKIDNFYLIGGGIVIAGVALWYFFIRKEKKCNCNCNKKQPLGPHITNQMLRPPETYTGGGPPNMLNKQLMAPPMMMGVDMGKVAAGGSGGPPMMNSGPPMSLGNPPFPQQKVIPPMQMDNSGGVFPQSIGGLL